MLNWVARLVLNGISYIFRDVGSVRFDEEQELTNEEKEIAKANIGVEDVTGAVMYNQNQELTEEQKATARNNIGAGTGGGGGGDVSSVNGQTGEVVLDATDVFAVPEPSAYIQDYPVVYKYDTVNDEWYTACEMLLNAEPKDSSMTQPVGIDANKRLWTAPTGGSSGAVSSVNGQTGAVTLDASDVYAVPEPVASINNCPIIYKVDPITSEWYTTCEQIIDPDPKDNSMTLPVGIDGNKKLWAQPNVTPSAKTSGMTQEVGIDSTYGTLWTYPSSGGGGGSSGLVVDTIWTNSNTEYSIFASTSIPFSDVGYDFFMILYKPRNNLVWAMPVCVVSKDYKVTNLTFYGWSGTDPASISVFTRSVTFGSSSITIGDGYVADGTVANYALIPLKIYGVRSAT